MYKIWKYKLDHLGFWLVTLLFYAFTRLHLIESAGWSYFIADVAVRNLLLASACYVNIYLLFEQFFRKSKYLLYGIFAVLLILTYTAFKNAFDAWLGNMHNTGNSRINVFYNTYYNFSIGFFYVAFTLALELSKRWHKQQLMIHQIQTEKLQTELKYLKAQLNPHFLFNCINTIYFQIDSSNDEARNSLEKFSEMLRYQLYKCNEELIPIEKETSYL